MTATPRTRVRLLARSGRAQPGIFAPLVLAQAAEIEALPLPEFLANATKLAKGLSALHQALGTDAVVTAGADGLLAEAAGAELDWSSYPPAVATPPAAVSEQAVVTHPRVEAAVEATARLAATLPGDPVLVAALTGPATLAAELGLDPSAEPELEASGRITLEVLKRFLDAGVNLVVVVEAAVPPAPAVDAWRAVVTPLVNVTRFHQAAPVLVFESPAPAVEAVPVSMGLCVPEGTTVGGPANRIKGVALSPEPKEWTVPTAGVPLAVTAGAVPGHCRFADVLEACERLVGGR